ncbi:32888_t:CDS:2, partial [Racocetra persica]
NQVVADEPDLNYLSKQTNDELNSGISSIYENENEENSLDGNSDEEDVVELTDISFNSFVGSKTDNKNYNWKLKNNESVRGQLINMTKRAIEEMKQSDKVRTVIYHRSSLEFKQDMYSWFNDDWIPLKTKALSKINLTVKAFSGEISEFITKVENFCTSYDYLRARKLLLEKMVKQSTNIKFKQILKVLDLFLENPYLFIRKNGQQQKYTEIQYVIKMVDPILKIIFSDCQSLVRLIWGETISQVTNNSKRKIDLCIRTEDGTKELSHSECAQKATMIKILKDQSKSFRTNKCILNKYLENDLPGEALENITVFELQLAALKGQLIGVDLLDEGLYFGFDGPAFEFLAQICSIDVLKQILEVLYYFKI